MNHLRFWHRVMTLVLPLVGLLSACQTTTQSLANQDLIERVAGDTIHLRAGSFALTRPLTFPSGTTVVGNGTELVLPQTDAFTPGVVLDGVRNLTLRGLTLRGDVFTARTDVNYLNRANHANAILIQNANNVRLENCVFRDLVGTGVKVLDSRQLAFRQCHFERLGLSTPPTATYSSDAIYLGGNSYVSDVTVTDCTFRNVGSEFPPGHSGWPNDGDGIQIASLGEVSNLTVRGSTFDRCSARGIKIQAGENILVEDNTFTDCGSAVVIAMIQPTRDVTVQNNRIDRVSFAVSTDNDQPGPLLPVHNLRVSNNEVGSCIFFFRNNGYTILRGGGFTDNRVAQIGKCFIDGRLVDATVRGNVIGGYAAVDDKSYDMAILLSPESENVTIENNVFGKSAASNRDVLNRSVKRIDIRNNTFKSERN